MSWRMILILAILGAPRLALGDIVIDDFSPASNDRFTNSPSLILHPFDLSGVGQTSTGVWATAISRNVIISANHLRPTGEVYFHPSNDPAQAPITRSIVSGTKIGSTDLYIAVLNANLPYAVAHYNYARELLTGTPPGPTAPLSVDSAGIYDGLTAFLFGRSPVAQAASRDQAIGQNKISGYSENVPFLGNSDNDSIIFAKDAPGDSEYVPFEAKFSGGDSGGPTFVNLGGELVLLGTNAFIYGRDPVTGIDDFEIGGHGSGINYIGNQAAFINDYIALHAVPEPGSGLLVLLASTFTLLKRRRQTRVG